MISANKNNKKRLIQRKPFELSQSRIYPLGYLDIILASVLRDRKQQLQQQQQIKIKQNNRKLNGTFISTVLNVYKDVFHLIQKHFLSTTSRGTQGFISADTCLDALNRFKNSALVGKKVSLQFPSTKFQLQIS